VARPKKSPEERRTEQFNIGLSPVELAQIKGKADETSQTVTAFIRASALEQKITVQKSTAPDFMTRNELRRIGTNLNQIAHALNSGRDFDTTELNAVIGKLDHLFDRWLNHDPESRQVRP
jgi:dynactin complex subunit